MPKSHASSLPLQDFCRMAVSRLLACVALVALLVIQAGMVWHGLEHVAQTTGKTAYSTNTLSAEKSQPASGLCFKCLEDLTHSVGLISQALQTEVSLARALQQAAFPACSFATPVELANQRGPPISLS
jgi:hypothetical protein